MTLSVTVTQHADGATVVSVRGEIDHGNAGELTGAVQSLFAASRPTQVRIDLGLVTFMDSGAISALVNAHRLAASEGAQLRVANASPFVHRQLTISGVAELLGTPPAPGAWSGAGPR